MENFIVKKLYDIRDEKYKIFQCNLMPGIDTEAVIGVRMPDLRKFAKELELNYPIQEFMDSLPHKYYEENMLHGIFIERIRDYNSCIQELNKFLCYVDNWATCDLISPRIFKKYTVELLNQIKIWLRSDHTYTVRFAIRMLMVFYSDEQFDKEHLKIVADVNSEEYYIRMMIAWYFATELAFHYDIAKSYLENKVLDRWVHNKTIQKAVESYRISAEHKIYLKGLRI